MPRRTLPFLCFFLLAAGLLLWGINWLAARPLFLDEANVARNLFDRDFARLLLPLDHRQYAPPLFLWLAKACGELFGYGENSLRLPAVGCGIATAALLWRMGNDWGTRLLLTGLLFINPTVLRYATELKPYAGDLLVSTAILTAALRSGRAHWGWMLGGALAPWLSLPAVFSLAGAGLVGLLSAKERRQRYVWIATGASWLVSFGLLYYYVLAPSLGDSALQEYHRSYFFILLPDSRDAFAQSARLLLGFPRLVFGYTIFSMLVGSVALAYGFWRSGWRQRILCLLPTLLVLLVSATGSYTLLPRLLLFVLPGWWWLAARGTVIALDRVSRGMARSIALCWLVVLGATNVVRHFVYPMRFSEARWLAWENPGDRSVYAHHSAWPVVDYYQRIHPDVPANQVVTEFSLRKLKGGDCIILFDGINNRETAEARRDIVRLAEKAGFTTEVVDEYPAGKLYLSDAP